MKKIGIAFLVFALTMLVMSVVLYYFLIVDYRVPPVHVLLMIAREVAVTVLVLLVLRRGILFGRYKGIAESLRQSEEKYRLVTESVNENIFIVDIQTYKFSFINSAVQKLTGYSVNEGMNLTLADILPPDSFNKAMRILDEELEFEQEGVFDPQRSRNVEVQIRVKDGTLAWFESTLSFLRNDAGEISGVLGVARDITKRKETETALYESEEKYRIIAESVSDMIWSVDPNTLVITDVSPAVERVLGYSPDDLVGKYLYDMFTGESYLFLRQVIEENLVSTAGGMPVKPRKTGILLLEQNHKQGNAVWTEVVLIFRRNKAADAVEIIGVSRDITEKKKTDEALRDSEEKARTLLNATTRSLTMIDPEGFILAMNEYEAQVLGKKVVDLVGTCIYDYYPPGWSEQRREKIREVAQYGKFVRFDEYREGKIFDTNVYPVFDDEGKVDRIALYSRDITMQRRLEKEILDISEKERIRIGHDLHDGIGQYFTGIGYLIRILINQLDKKGMPEVELAREIVDLVNEAKSHVRILSKGLCPVHMDEYGLITALEELCINTQRIYEIACNLLYDDGFLVTDNAVATHIYYIIREAVNNAIKHGNAKNIQVLLRNCHRKILILIKDDGSGFVDNFEEKQGIGLDLMKYRSAIIGANLEFGENFPSGSIVSCIIDRESHYGETFTANHAVV